jgi:hypothetical protein
MTNPLDTLNLRPQERRILVVVAFLIFVVLNFWFVTPLFGQFGVMQGELEKARRTQARYEDEIAKVGGYEKMEADLKKQGGDVLNEELQLQRIIDNQARASEIAVSRYAPGVRNTTRTNQFFEDQGLTIDFVSASTNLIEFMVGLASGNSMIHIQDMSLRPDGSGTKLAGNMLFVASYQKKTPTIPQTSGAAPKAIPTANAAKATPPPVIAPATNKPAVKPATNTVKSAALPSAPTNSAKAKK